LGTTENLQTWSKTAATNANADLGINWAEGQDSATVNNSARGMMAATAKYIDDTDGAIVASGGGTANALIVATSQVLEAAHLTNGLRLMVRAIADNTAVAVTIAVDGIAPKPIKRVDSSALAIGSIRQSMQLDLVYHSGLSEFHAVNIPPVQGFGGGAAFSAHKNGVAQTIITTAVTNVTFPTEVFDVGPYFSAHTWVPPAGIVSISAAGQLSSFDAGGFNLSIYKGGTLLKTVGNSGDIRAHINVIDQAGGTDGYQVFVDTVTDNNYTISGAAHQTWFMGAVL